MKFAVITQQSEYTSLSVGLALSRGKRVSVAQWNELVLTYDYM